MRRKALGLCLALCFLSSATRALSQAFAQVSETETINGNGWLVIELDCYAIGSWIDPDDGSQDYEGVSIGSSNLHGCQLNDPNGQSQYQDSGGPYADELLQEQVVLPVTMSGTWDYWASFWIWLWPCDSDTEDCEGYPNDDAWGYSWYVDDPAYCELNGDECEGPYNGEDTFTDYNGLEYAYSGDSYDGDFGTFYVNALAIDISPSSYTLDAGESATLTGEASNTANFIPFYEWTLVSGPSGSGSGAVSGDGDMNYTSAGWRSSGRPARAQAAATLRWRRGTSCTSCLSRRDRDRCGRLCRRCGAG